MPEPEDLNDEEEDAVEVEEVRNSIVSRPPIDCKKDDPKLRKALNKWFFDSLSA